MKTKKFIVFFLFLCMILTGPIMAHGVQAEETEASDDAVEAQEADIPGLDDLLVVPDDVENQDEMDLLVVADDIDNQDEINLPVVLENDEKQDEGELEFAEEVVSQAVGADDAEENLYNNLDFWIVFEGPNVYDIIRNFNSKNTLPQYGQTFKELFIWIEFHEYSGSYDKVDYKFQSYVCSPSTYENEITRQTTTIDGLNFNYKRPYIAGTHIQENVDTGEYVIAFHIKGAMTYIKDGGKYQKRLVGKENIKSVDAWVRDTSNDQRKLKYNDHTYVKTEKNELTINGEKIDGILAYYQQIDQPELVVTKHKEITKGQEFDLSSLIETAKDEFGNDVTDDISIDKPDNYDLDVSGDYVITFTLKYKNGEDIVKKANLSVKDEVIYNNLDLWVVFAGPNVYNIINEYNDNQQFPGILNLTINFKSGATPVVFSTQDLSKGDLKDGRTENGEIVKYNLPYIADTYTNTQENIIAFNIKGAVKHINGDLDGKLIDVKRKDFVGIEVRVCNPDSSGDTDVFEYKNHTYVRKVGGVIENNKGNKDIQSIKAGYVEVYQPILEVKFEGGDPEDFDVTATIVGDYNDPAARPSDGSLTISLENQNKLNTHNLFTNIMKNDFAERSKIEHFQKPATKKGDYQYNHLYKYELTIPDLDNFTKQVTQEGTHENDYHWKVTYTAKKVDKEQDKEYTLTFDLAGGMYNGQTGTYYIKAKDGDIITLPAPTRAGHTFSHWQGSKYYAGESYTVTENHAFVAVWEEDPIPTNTSDSLPRVVIPIVTSTEPSVTVPQASAPQASVARDDISKLPSTGQSSGMSVAGAGLLILASTVFAVNNILNKKKGHK